MSTSQRTFEQVKSILGKLDRERDAARQRRTATAPAPRPADLAAKPALPGAASPLPLTTPAPAASPAAQPGTNGQSGYGRARPMRPFSSIPPAPPSFPRDPRVAGAKPGGAPHNRAS